MFAVGAPATNIVPEVLQSGVAFDDPSLSQWHLEWMDVDRLWDSDSWVGPSGVQVRGWPVSSRVTVAVIDDGVDGEHRDLALRVSRVGNDCHREPLGDHGTHVAGIVSAVQGNDRDTAGVAPYATILPVKVHFGDNYVDWATRTGPDDETCFKIVPTLTRAIDRARLAGADVVNMSLRWIDETDYLFLYDRAREEYGSDDQGLFEGLRSFYEAITSEPDKYHIGVDTVEWAIRVAQMQGVIFVAAAGNCGNNQNQTIDGITQPGWAHDGCVSHNQQQPPAKYPGVIAVAATDRGGNRADFSTSNVDVDIAAPGAEILSTVPSYAAESGDPCPVGATCHVREIGGTSMASPMVAAVVAQMKGRYPEATLRQITDALELTADHKGQGKTLDLGHGIVDPAAALEHLARQFEDEERIPAVGAPSGDSPVVLVVGDSAQDLPGCASRHCAHLQITLEGAVADDYQVACWSSLDPDQPWHTDTWHWPTSSFWSEDGCWFGVPGEQVWVTVNGIRSNTITWPAASSAAPGEVTGLAYDPATGTATWNPTPGADSYQVNELVLTDESEGGLVYLDIDCCSYTIDDPAITHVAIRAANSDGEGPWSSRVSTAIAEVSITAGWSHSCWLRADNTVTCWGNNEFGQTSAPAGTFRAVTAGWINSCGLRTDGTVTCWGGNDFGESGAPAGTFRAVSVGDYHSCGLRTDSTVTCWGADESGQTGAPAGTFRAVSVGDYHSCGLRTDDTVTCWGGDESGQISAPAGTFRAVTAGFYHTCGLRHRRHRHMLGRR